MTQRVENKQQLSKSILEMKFMKRSKMRVEQEKELEDGKAMFADAATDDMKRESKFIIESSYVPCERLIVGRLSFQGMNPDIERLMASENATDLEKEEAKKEKEVTDQDMAQRYALTSNIGKKFNTKRENRMKQEKVFEPKSKNLKFPKPETADSKGEADKSGHAEPRTKKLKFLKPKD